MSEPFIGQIQMFGFNFAPVGWAKCDGTILQISNFTALFSLLGTTYGGDGRTTFALPDLQGRAVLHQGSGPGLTPRTIGEKGGAETVTLNTAQMPSHTHVANLHARNEMGSMPKPQDNLLAVAPNIYGSGNQDATMSSQAISVDNAGGSQPHENMEPFQVINYCIALTGVFPPPP